MARLLIGEVAKLLGVTTKTIRYYEEIGLLDKPARTEAGYRLYHPRHLLQFFRIKQLQGLGLSLEHIQSLLKTPDQDTPFDEILRALDAELAVEIAALEARRRQIQELLTQEPVDLLKQSGGSSPTLKLLRDQLGEQANLEEAAASYENNLFAQLDSFLWTLPEYRKQQQDLIRHMTDHPQAWSQLANIMVRIASLSEAAAEGAEVEELAEEVARLPEQNAIVAEILSSIHLMEGTEHLAEVLTGKAAAELSASQQKLFQLVGLRWGHSPDAVDDYSW
jgi:DNA-binding transcriptional MerR regulator